MNILQEIFNDFYEEMIYTLHPRKSVIENTNKMLNCGDPAFDSAMYGCPHCGKPFASSGCMVSKSLYPFNT